MTDTPKTSQSLSDGSPITPDHRDIDPVSGQQKGYVVLTQDEIDKGYVRPVREKYVHTVCGSVTRMNLSIAKTYASSPTFYSGTFCVKCRRHFPLDQFVWDGTSEIVGS